MLVCFFCCSGLEIVHNKAGDKVALAEATKEQVRGWAIVTVRLSKTNADKLLEQEIDGGDLVEFATLPKAEIEAKLLAAPYLLSGSAALDLAKAISGFASTTTGAFSGDVFSSFRSLLSAFCAV